MELPKRKNTRLAGYDYTQPGYYFITICTHNRRNLLSRIVGDAAYGIPCPISTILLTEAGQMADRYILNIEHVHRNVHLKKYVIMPNHIHLMIAIGLNKLQEQDGMPWAASPTISLSQIINTLKAITSKHYGAALWQRSYYDHIIRDEADYLRIWEYIATNPLKWELDRYYSTE